MVLTQTQLRPMSFGEILDGTFSLYRRHFFAMFGAALIAFIPGWLLYAAVMARVSWVDSQVPPPDALPIALLAGLVGIVGFALAMGALTWQVSRAYLGEPVSIGDALGSGFGRILALLVVLFLAYLALLGPTVLAGAVAAILIPTLAATGAGIIVGGVVGFLAVAVALVLTPIVASGLFAVVPAVIVERKGPIAALRRSWALSKGAWLRIMGVLGVSWLIAIMPSFAVGIVGGIGAVLFGSGTGTVSTVHLYVQQGLSSVVWALTFPFLIGCTVLQYYDRRIRQEGYDLEVAAESLAAVD
ncbi:MAG TPA: hypothetical protein VF188_04045 [Longimicrobiales bacterium]